LEDTLSALINLGYQRSAAEKALNTAARENVEMSVSTMIRRCLQILAKG
jgi:Holliday junction resolvasome RuvABC DNA-binding subunit